MKILRYKNFSKSDNKEGDNKGRDIAVAGLTTAGVAGGSLLHKSIKDKRAKTEHKEANEKLSENFKRARRNIAEKRRGMIKATKNAHERLDKDLGSGLASKIEIINKGMGIDYDPFVEALKKSSETNKNDLKKSINKIKTAAHEDIESLKRNYESDLRKNSRKLRKSLNKNKKVATAGLIAAPIAGAAAYGVSRAIRGKKNKKEDDK